MAGTQPALLTLVGHASQMSADAHHHQPLGLLDACAVRLRILAAAAERHGGDLLGRAVKYEHRLAAPGDGVHFTGAEARQMGTLVLAYSDSTISAPLSWILLASAPRRSAMAQPP